MLTWDAQTKRALITTSQPRERAPGAVVIGGSTPDKFLPNINVSRWANECFVNMNFEDLTVKNETEIFADGRIEITIGPATFFAYCDDGYSLEFGIRLSRRVATLTQIRLPLLFSGNLVFHYQGELTQAEIDRGCYRPPNVVGSYAIYHAAKKNNEYTTGKFAHLYRWDATDALGNKAWCDPLQITGNRLIIGLPVTWLQTATYPVTFKGA